MPHCIDAGSVDATYAILSRCQSVPGSRPLRVGLSGIDGSGKARLAQSIVYLLRAGGMSAVVIPVDWWLTREAAAAMPEMTPREFLERAIRFDEVFREMESRSESVVLVEGIFLFRRAFAHRLDLRLWLNCSFATAMDRAVQRRQEGLGPDETRIVYDRLYFPAQRLHIEEDDPVGRADLVITNDGPAPLRRPTSSSRPAFRQTAGHPAGRA